MYGEYYKNNSDYDDENDRMNDFSTQLTEAQFWYLLSLFPNLQDFDIQNSEHKVLYIHFLSNFRKTQQQLPLLENIELSPSRSKYARYEDSDDDFHKLCFATYYLFRRTLKSMKVTSTNMFNEGGKFMKSLVEFKNLRSLHIINHVDQNLTLFHLLQGCPNLASLKYESGLLVPEKEAQQLKSMQQKLENQNSCISQSLRNLERIELHLRRPVTPYIDFFANHYPQNLKRIVLDFMETGHYGLLREEEAAVILDLCESLQKCNSVQLKIGRIRLVNDNAVESFLQILNALTGEKEFRKHSAVYTFGGDVDGDISVNGSELSYNCPINQYFCNEVSDLPVPSSLKQLAKVDNVTVDLGHRGELTHYLMNYLKYLQKYYPQLKWFQVKGGCTWFKAECLDPSNPSLEYMTSITMDSRDLSEEQIDLLVAYFPKIKVLSSSFCSSSKIIRKSFNLSKFKCLQTLTINILGGPLSMQSPIFLEYTDSRRSIQYLIDKWNAKDEIANRIESMSDDISQKHKKRNTDVGYTTICVETSNPIAKIEVTVNNNAWATLDL
ncbi:unnamed protein product [Mucor hiemalis]